MSFSSLILSQRKGCGECACTNMAQRVIWPGPTMVCHGHVFSCFSVLDSQFLPCGWLLLLPLLFLIPVLGSVDLCFLHWAAFGPSVHTVLHLKYGNNISYVAETLARLNEMMLSPTFGI